MVPGGGSMCIVYLLTRRKSTPVSGIMDGIQEWLTRQGFMVSVAAVVRAVKEIELSLVFTVTTIYLVLLH